LGRGVSGIGDKADVAIERIEFMLCGRQPTLC